MRKVLVWVVVGLAVLWGGYWFVGAHLIERRLHGWVASERAAGNRAEFSVLRVQGFPSRFDIHAEQIDLFNPGTGWGWRAPVAELAALSYQPQHYIAVLPRQQRFETPAGALELASGDLRASLVFLPGPSFVLNRTSLVASDLLLRPAEDGKPGEGEAGATPGQPGAPLASLGELRLATRRVPGDRLSHRVGLELTGLELSPALFDLLASTGATRGQAASRLLGRTQAHVHLDAVLSFDRRLDRRALADGPPQPTGVRLDALSLEWGPVALSLDGALQIDAEGVPQGTLAGRLIGLSELLDLAEEVGLVAGSGRTLLERTVRLAATVAGAPKDGPAGELRLNVTFSDGLMRLGAVPLGPAPRLRLP